MRGGISFVLLVKATLDHHRHLDHPTTTSSIIIPFLRKKREKNRRTPTTNDDRPPLPPPPPPSPAVASSSTYSSSTLSPFSAEADEVQLEKFVVGEMIDEDDDDRLDDGDSGGIAYQMRSITVTPSGNSSSSSYNYAMLPPPAPPVEFRDANSGRNSSIDEHDWFGEFDGGGRRSRSSCAASFNTFFDLDDNNQNNNNNTTLFDHHSSPLPDDFHQHRPQNHNQSADAGAFFSLDPLGVGDYDGGSFSSVSDQSTEGALPEFVGSGGGQGIFKVPLRAPVHPDRPPSLELRPHPLRETQAGSFLRTIACTPSQLWAGQESGVRFWNFVDVFKGREEIWRTPLGDEESAPFHESRRDTSPTLCFAVDVANQLVWSGHKDGKIRSWRMDQPGSSAASSSDRFFGDSGFGSNDDCNAATYFKEGLSWQAHRGPVLSLTFTSYGDLWSGAENGVIKAWPWEVIHKSLSLAMEERHMSALLVERSNVDLRSQVTVGGVCPLPSADVKFLLSDNSSLKVWSGGSLSFSLWNSRTKELLKVFSIDGQIETRVDIPSGHELYIEDDMKVKVVSTSSKKEKSQGPMSFFQRSRNALMGAADVVRRVATKGTFGDDNRKTEAITMSMDGMIWTGCANGALVQWDGNGNRSQEFQYHSSSVQCLCSFGSRLWVGYLNGSINVLDLEGNRLGGWVAHSSPVINMAVGGGYIFTLANHGGIRGWNLNSPGPVDDILKLELANKELSYTKLENIKILVGSWNVGQERASHDSLISWIGCSASEAAIVVVGLQEVEMGAGFLAMAAAKETVGLEGSANGHWWLDTIGKTLDEGTSFERVGSRQLAGLLISVWARKNLRKYIGDVDAGAVPCGFGRAIGNKGSVGLKMRVYDKIFCFLNCHFAAHLEAVNRRNSDFDHVYRAMSFSRPSNAGAGSSSAVQLLRGPNATGLQSDDGKPELCEADMIVFLGDLNYRLQGISYDEARDFVSQRCFDWLRENDQLRSEMKAGRVFQGMREGIIRFPPTYKFERHQIGLAGYDSGEQKRIPAWCDRILYRDSHSISAEECFLSCPVAASILQYGACMDVTDSDHKPVRCLFDVNIARVDELVRRQEFGQKFMANEKIRSSLEESSSIPETIVSTNNLILQNKDKTILCITNKCNIDSAIFEVSCDGQSSVMDDGYPSEHYPRGAFGFPRWLEVTPATGIIKPGQTMEVLLHHVEFQTTEEFVVGVPQNLWCEDTRDKEVRLVVNVSGSFSTVRRSHHIHVYHCFSSKTSSNKLKDSSRAVQSNILHRSDFCHISTDIDDMRYLHNS